LFFWIAITWFPSLEAAGWSASIDLSQEQGWAEQFSPRSWLGEEVVKLSSSTGKSMAMYYRAAGRSEYGAIILLPTFDTHPNGAPIGILRIALAHHGWHTLAVQLPTLVEEAGPTETVSVLPLACARLQAAIAWFSSRKLTENLVVLGHGLGAIAAATCVSELREKSPVHGLILLGAGVPGIPPKGMDILKLIEKIGVPILDLYGEHDALAERENALVRAAIGRRNRDRPYVQISLPGADHLFSGVEEDAAVPRISAWLSRYVVRH